MAAEFNNTNPIITLPYGTQFYKPGYKRGDLPLTVVDPQGLPVYPILKAGKQKRQGSDGLPGWVTVAGERRLVFFRGKTFLYPPNAVPEKICALKPKNDIDQAIQSPSLWPTI